MEDHANEDAAQDLHGVQHRLCRRVGRHLDRHPPGGFPETGRVSGGLYRMVVGMAVGQHRARCLPTAEAEAIDWRRRLRFDERGPHAPRSGRAGSFMPARLGRAGRRQPHLRRGAQHLVLERRCIVGFRHHVNEGSEG